MNSIQTTIIRAIGSSTQQSRGQNIVVKRTLPAVPELYQGNTYWCDTSLSFFPHEAQPTTGGIYFDGIAEEAEKGGSRGASHFEMDKMSV